MPPIASPGLSLEIQAHVPKWLRGIHTRRRRPLGACPDLRSSPPAPRAGAPCAARHAGPVPAQGLLVPALHNLSLPLSLIRCCPSPGPHSCGGDAAASPLVFRPLLPHPVLLPTCGSPGVGGSRSPLSGSPIFPRTRPSSQPASGGLLVLVRRAESRTSVSSSVEWHGQACLGGLWAVGVARTLSRRV